MPTNANAYNSRVTDEALEKQFRDTFTSQGGSELVSDLYASGVIVPIVDFTAAAEGEQLPQNLQTAWDFSTGHSQISNATTTIINTTGFWQVGVQWGSYDPSIQATLRISDGLSTKIIFQADNGNNGPGSYVEGDYSAVVFLRSGDSLTGQTTSIRTVMDVWYRQIADVNGNLTNPLGFSFS